MRDEDRAAGGMPRAKCGKGADVTQIPSNLAISGAGAPHAARETVKEREARRAGDETAASRQAKSLDQAIDTVETGDADSRVFTDAEGTGSQGRAFDDTPADQPESEAPPTSNGITRDDDGVMHVDVEA